METGRGWFRGLLAGAALTGMLSYTALAAAQPAAVPTVEVIAHILTQDGEDWVVDLGASGGAHPGDVVELWRPLKIKHPVTGRVITDRFRIGALKLGQVQGVIALARPVGDLLRAPQVGDVIILRRAAPPPPPPAPRAGAPAPSASAEAPPPPPPPPPEPAPSPESAEEREVADLVAGVFGTDIEVRVERYEAYAAAHPDGRYSAVLRAEAAKLRALLERSPPPPDPDPPPLLRRFDPPQRVREGLPFTLGVQLGQAARSVLLHLRSPGQHSYQTLALSDGGAGFWSVTVPVEPLRPPRVEYFLEVIDAQGQRSAVFARPDTPAELPIEPTPMVPEDAATRSSARLWTDYADYNRLRGNDRVWQTEGDLGVRYGDLGVRAVHTGFGVYRGRGGNLVELDERGYEPRASGLTYGYVELELGLARSIGLVGRGILGLRATGVSSGAQAMVRLGNDQETNLLLGGEVLGGVGFRLAAELSLDTLPSFPMRFRTDVTDQPAGGTDSNRVPGPEDPPPGTPSRGNSQLGARAIAEVGYRITPSLTVMVRGSYQGRTIDHSGPGAGAGVGYSW